jgi:polyvinyl alcohol dehydrogenase (cytochrome)
LLAVVAAVLAMPGRTSASVIGSTPIGPADWPMYNHDIAGSRSNPAETALSPTTVGRLRVLWTLPTPAAVHGTPAVVGDTVYVGDGAGNFYALDAATGVPRWVAKVASPITASPLVTDRLVIFGDWNGFIHGLDRTTGLPAWPPFRPNDHDLASAYSSPTPVGDLVAVGIASNEEIFAVGARPGVGEYPCCTFRGSVVAFDPLTGQLAWQTYMISDEESAAGSSGSGVWATPTYDPDSGLLYVSTGNNYSEPATGTSDSVLALDARTGRIVWKNQLYPNDVWNFQYQVSDEHPDWDFGDSPQLFRLTGGRKVVIAGQKSGFLHLLDASTGHLLDNVQLEPGGALGGLFADSATTGGVTYANGSNWPFEEPLLCPCPGGAGHLFAIRTQTPKLKELWRLETPDSPNLGGTAVANGVVYFITSRSGVLLAVDAATGTVLASIPLGVAINGPSVSHGRVFAGTGDLLGFISSTSPNGSVVALGL